MNATIILLNVPIILFFKQRITKALIIIQMQLPWKLYESRGLLLAGCEFKNNISVILFPSLFILFENQTHHLVLMIFFESINLSVKARSITTPNKSPPCFFFCNYLIYSYNNFYR